MFTEKQKAYSKMITSIEKWTVWDSMTEQEKLNYHIEKFKSKPEWQRLQDATLFIRFRLFKKIARLWLKTKIGKWWLIRKKIRFWTGMQNDYKTS